MDLILYGNPLTVPYNGVFLKLFYYVLQFSKITYKTILNFSIITTIVKLKKIITE